MTTKFQIGSLWRTRGGDKVMVVDVMEDEPTPIGVYHYEDGNLYWHDKDGHLTLTDYRNDDLISPWKEPIKVKAKIGIYLNKDATYYATSILHCGTTNLIAIKEIEIEVFEGEGL